ncbi:MAG: hypothetical protein WC310_04060 [Patescibacteria group bacterium]|jgi:hypothetical protein
MLTQTEFDALAPDDPRKVLAKECQKLEIDIDLCRTIYDPQKVREIIFDSDPQMAKQVVRDMDSKTSIYPYQYEPEEGLQEITQADFDLLPPDDPRVMLCNRFGWGEKGSETEGFHLRVNRWGAETFLRDCIAHEKAMKEIEALPPDNPRRKLFEQHIM